MKRINGDTQMTDVWRMPAIALWENHAQSIQLKNRWVCLVE